MDSSSTFECVVTTLGLAKIAAAVANGSTVNISQIALGDGGGNPVTPSANQTALVREVYRAGINSLSRDPVNTNYIIAELDIPADVGGWTVREFGVFDNAGALIAVGQYPDSYKPLPTQGAARDMIIRVILQITDAATVNLVIDGNLVVASRKWVQDNFGAASLFPGGTTGEVLTKKSNADGDVEWRNQAEALNVTVDVAEENQTLALGQTAVTLTTVTTDSIAVYIDGKRLRNNQYSVTGETTITLNDSPSDGQKITIVQNEPAGADEFLRSFRNLADVPDKAKARENLGIATQNETVLAVLKALYPIGEVYTTRRTGNPADLLGFGTWERYAAGRTLVGLNPSDATFNAVDLEGGVKSHVLTTSEVPAHTHDEAELAVTVTDAPNHTHGYSAPVWQAVPVGASGAFGAAWAPQAANTGGGGAHGHTAKVPAHKTGSTGSGWAHNNLQPYKVVNMWIRTA